LLSEFLVKGQIFLDTTHAVAIFVPKGKKKKRTEKSLYLLSFVAARDYS